MGKSGLIRNLAFILIAVFIVMATLISPVQAATVNTFFLYKTVRLHGRHFLHGREDAH